VEGAIAGLISGALISFIIGTSIFGILSAWQSLLLGLTLATMGQFSDLAESLIKRDAGIKDSGNTIPGHGGVLDRFDSYFFAAPTAYFLILFLQGTNY
jgi:phosphatidate cytidylyltransferase